MPLRLLTLAVIALAVSTQTEASDHIDNVGTLGSHGQVDISDLYAYFGERDCTAAPDLAACLRDRPLTLVVNTYPGAKAGSHFSHHVAYEILVSPGQIDERGILRVSDVPAAVIRCSFEDHVTPVVTTCAGVRGGEISRTVSAPAEAMVERDDVRLFSGLRADPFFFSIGHFEKIVARSDAFPPPVAPRSADDMIDGEQDWQPDRLDRLIEMLLQDRLAINRAAPCDPDGAYLSIERALLGGDAPLGCGARALEEDIFRRMYTLFIAGLDGDEAGFGMGVDGPYSSSEKTLSPAFPYLAEAWEEQWPHWLEFYRGGQRQQAVD